ncbi:hypothetical protein NVP1238A_83 [Vibrio phage 1.238.A._10N.261.52.F10]|uniref:Uncharacterized protein n=1 Tax=Vibrio phage 1.238.A._10N.261.52.F10 TaxID=1881231 RepID=A0A2I7RUI4_9CAUD|nr:hypothetical protein KNT79_gp83 [Vibrio phage 1.238.A._10N.261.52.F10]AUR97332.1 hypothetical protein NVP1238A_83 [Vibrio phage 1.238.A._10N.261.52.F10]AUR97426.1 hypothetical protein NVP1238B_84 [Vibrio phage 1.238.B._10N.261.52.F10]
MSRLSKIDRATQRKSYHCERVGKATGVHNICSAVSGAKHRYCTDCCLGNQHNTPNIKNILEGLEHE